MKRKQIFQFSSQSWYPEFMKRLMYEFMTWFVNLVHAAKPFMPVIEEGLNHSDTNHIVHLDGKIGAEIETVQPYLKSGITLESQDVHAFRTESKGLYLSVNSFHQLPEKKAVHVLQKVVNARQPVVIVEGNNDSLWQVVGMFFFVPLSVILFAPFVRPFRWERLVFTYLIPILPIMTSIDGFLALFKLYNPNDLIELTKQVDAPDYYWRAAKDDNNRGGKIMYLIGYPKA